MEDQTLYERLGLPRDASPEEIRHAYRQLVLRLHPDRNIYQGETELFIDIQQAYEMLADPVKKADYDHKLPVEPSVESPISVNLFYSQPALVRLPEPQVIYALMELNLHPDTGLLVTSTPLNVALVVDCSTSMQGIRLDTVKLTAIELIRQLQPNDLFSLIKFNDRAELLIPAGRLPDIKSTEMKIQLLQAGGGTEIYKGLEMGFAQVSQSRSSNRVNHIVLITDGRTYGDEIYCEQLADQSSALGIGISALGIGSQWNDKFLDRITSKTGGICKYVSDISDIRTTLLEEISRLGSNLTEQINFSFQAPPYIELHSAFRLQPDPSPLVIGSPMILGLMPSFGSMKVLLEFMLKEIPAEMAEVIIAKGFMSYEIPRHRIKIQFVQRMVFERKITLEPVKADPPVEILNAMKLLSLYHMQERAREAMMNGDVYAATTQMQNLATHLLSKGEKLLAQSVLDEVDYMRRNQAFSEDGEKRIKYGTRALLLPAGTEEKNV